MKRLLLLLFSCILLIESKAQNETVNKLKYRLPGSYNLRSYNQRITTSTKDSNIVLHNLNSLTGKKPGVYRLPQDNMPCIVPDTSRIVNIPNAWRGPIRIPYKSRPPRMPNPSRQWVPTPITNTGANAETATR